MEVRIVDFEVAVQLPWTSTWRQVWVPTRGPEPNCKGQIFQPSFISHVGDPRETRSRADETQPSMEVALYLLSLLWILHLPKSGHNRSEIALCQA